MRIVGSRALCLGNAGAHARYSGGNLEYPFPDHLYLAKKPAFKAPYTGDFSLQAGGETAHSFSATAALGWRPWRGGELYFDPEAVQGVPLSDLKGLGGMTNGEQQKTSGPSQPLRPITALMSLKARG